MEAKIYLPLCEQYHSLAKNFFAQYVDITSGQHPATSDWLENPEESTRLMCFHIARLQAAICSVIFEALSIESLINFFGAVTLGDDIFYKKYEAKKRYSTLKKLEEICKQEFSTPYPGSVEHNAQLRQLFEKRNKLVHNKPMQHTIVSSNSFDDYHSAYREISFVFNNLEAEIGLYDEVKSNLIACCGTDPFRTLVQSASESIKQSIFEMFTYGHSSQCCDADSQ